MRSLGDISLAEEAVQDAFATALVHWPESGIPPAPAGWIITTARNRAIDRLRRDASRDAAARRGNAARANRMKREEHDVRDERLRLMFTCCHPSLAPEARVALTLRLLGGLTTTEIAHAFLVPETTMGQRLSRAKAKIRDAGIPYRIPDPHELPERLGAVLAAIYLVFNEGYSASGGEQLVRGELCDEALRLGKVLLELMPEESEVLGLVALMLLIDARRAARTDAAGRFMRLAEQDRVCGIARRSKRLRPCSAPAWRAIGPAPTSCRRPSMQFTATRRMPRAPTGAQILALYDQWMAIAPSPLVALNRAVAVAEVQGAELALRLVDELELARYHLLHAVRGDLLRRLGRGAEAAAAYRTAIELCSNAREREYLERQMPPSSK